MAITTIFSNNRTQAVRLPAELRLPETVKKSIFGHEDRNALFRPLGKIGIVFFSMAQQ
jgi:antitoxin VapB